MSDLKPKILFSTLILAIIFSCNNKRDEVSVVNHWSKMQQIIDSISVPVFSDKVFSVMDYGSVADGVFDNTKSFEDAIKACSQNGGGKVLIPKGKYFSGPIHLEDNVNLHLDDGAEILFSTNPKDYYPLVHTSYEGTELMNYSPLIYAYKKKNIAITGKGILNGQASNDNWWPWCGKDVYGWKEGMGNQKDSLNLPVLMEMGKTIPL